METYEEYGLTFRDRIRIFKSNYYSFRKNICEKLFILEFILFPFNSFKLLLRNLKIIKGGIWRPLIVRKMMKEIKEGKYNKWGQIEGSIFYEEKLKK